MYIKKKRAVTLAFMVLVPREECLALCAFVAKWASHHTSLGIDGDDGIFVVQGQLRAKTAKS